jgi:hypothetical protein
MWYHGNSVASRRSTCDLRSHASHVRSSTSALAAVIRKLHVVTCSLLDNVGSSLSSTLMTAGGFAADGALCASSTHVVQGWGLYVQCTIGCDGGVHHFMFQPA